MINHSLLKLTLFMAAGVIVMNLHRLVLDEIRGWGRNKTALKIAFALGGLGISGVPLFNGYISKTLLHEGIVEGFETLEEAEAAAAVSAPGISAALYGAIPRILHCAEWIFLISGGIIGAGEYCLYNTQLYELVPGFVFSLLTIIGVSLLTEEPSKEIVDEFETYEEEMEKLASE